MPIYLPDELLSVVDSKRKKLSDRAYVNDQRLTEMWCAGKFANGYAKLVAPCKIEIATEDEQREYDFHLLVERSHISGNSERLPFQVIEVIQPGRRRDSDLKELGTLHAKLKAQASTIYNSREAAKLAKKTIQKKVKKRYADASALNILLYLNINAKQARWVDMLNECEDPSSHFESVWVVSTAGICCLASKRLPPNFTGWKMIDP